MRNSGRGDFFLLSTRVSGESRISTGIENHLVLKINTFRTDGILVLFGRTKIAFIVCKI